MKHILKYITISVCIITLFHGTALADNRSITSLEVTRYYDREEMNVSTEAFAIDIPTWNTSFEYEIIGEPEVNEPVTYEITVTADDGYDFHGLKIGSCNSSAGTFSELELSEDRKTAFITFIADPPEIILKSPENLRWKGSTAHWNPVEYADEYEVTLHYITDKGKISSSKLATFTTKDCSLDFAAEIYRQPRDYVFTVIAHPDPSSSFLKSSKATLDFESSLMINEEELGLYDGRWYVDKDGNKYYKKSGNILSEGLHRIEGYYYLLSEKGHVLYKWQLLNGTYYYFNPTTGIMMTGPQVIDNVQYIFDNDGRMLTGWQTIDRKTYYMSDMGNVLTGWQAIDGKYYYFFDDGHLNKNKNILAGKKVLCTFDTKTGALISTYRIH